MATTFSKVKLIDKEIKLLFPQGEPLLQLRLHLEKPNYPGLGKNRKSDIRNDLTREVDIALLF